MRILLCLMLLAAAMSMFTACASDAADAAVKAADTQPSTPMNAVTDPTKVPGPDTHNTMR